VNISRCIIKGGSKMNAAIRLKKPVLVHRIIEGSKTYYKAERDGKSACGKTCEESIQTLIKKFACGW